MININGVEIPNKLDELTIRQYEVISRYTANNNLDNIEKYVKIFTFLGANQSDLDALDFKDFKTLVEQFNNIEPFNKIIEEIEINGYIYKAKEKLTIKDLKLVEKIIRKEHYISELMAIVYQRVDLSDTEHYTPTHIKLKSKLFSKQPAQICISHLVSIGQYFKSELEKNTAETVS
jgi:hypothetical protein